MPGDVLMGRRLAIGALRAAVDKSFVGAGGVVLLTGDAGMGKTALVTETVSYSRARGAMAVWGTCWEGDGAPGYWPWIQVARALAPADGETGPGLLGELTGSGAGQDGLLSDDAARRFRTCDAATAYLRERARTAPVLLILEDLHWADISSLRLLAFLARNLRDVAALVVGTYRDVEVAADDHPARALLAEIAGQAAVVQLTGLAADEVGQLLETVIGEAPPKPLITAVHERTGGNPFFVQQLGRLLAPQARQLDAAQVSGVPRAVGEVLARRLARLPQDVVDLLGIAAVLGTRFSITTVATVADTPIDRAVSLLDTAASAGVVEHEGAGAARFSHDLFRDVVYDGLPTITRSARHLAIADALERERGMAASAGAVAHHRVQALPLGDRARAVGALLNAGREAAGRAALDVAAAHLGRAVELEGGVDAADLDLLCEWSDVLRREGHGAAAQAGFVRAAERARVIGDPTATARAAFGAHRVPTQTDSSRADVIALLEGAVEMRGGDDAELRWLLTAALSRELADGPHADRARAVTLAEAAVEGARAAGTTRALAYGLFALADTRWEPGRAAERLTLADELGAAAAAAGETELLLEAHLARLVALLELGDPGFAPQLDVFDRLASQSSIPRYMYLAQSRRATQASLSGPFELADQLIASAAAYGELIGEPDTWGVQASQLIGLALLRHDWTRVHQLAEARGERLSPAEFSLQERAWLLLEAGDRAGAAALVASIPERPALYRWRHLALLTMDAELAAAVGATARCAVLYEQLLPLADQFAVVASAVFTTGPVALQLGLLAAALGRSDDAIAHLGDAAARSDRLGAPLLAARARDKLAELRSEGGEGVGNVFRRDGDTWALAFAGRTVQVRDAKGLRDLALLLGSPGREVTATDLVAAGAGDAPAPVLGADPILDDAARAAYRRRLTVLDEDLAEADAHGSVERSSRLTAERAALIDELSRAAGLGGRRRRLGDTAERARTTVTARIRDAIGRIERSHPELGAHLRASVYTGTRCVYRPAETVRWQISQS